MYIAYYTTYTAQYISQLHMYYHFQWHIIDIYFTLIATSLLEQLAGLFNKGNNWKSKYLHKEHNNNTECELGITTWSGGSGGL